MYEFRDIVAAWCVHARIVGGWHRFTHVDSWTCALEGLRCQALYLYQTQQDCIGVVCDVDFVDNESFQKSRDVRFILHNCGRGAKMRTVGEQHDAAAGC